MGKHENAATAPVGCKESELIQCYMFTHGFLGPKFKSLWQNQESRI